ncbi:MAG: 50S ribosomal protein L22 [bacterium]|nr:50S ribosomal protein L22 [bacterium]
MEYKATLRYLHITPRKVRLLADLVRGRGTVQARNLLSAAPQRASRALGKLLDSAVANALQQGAVSQEVLRVKSVRVDMGPKRRRALPRAFGRTSPIDKRMSHVTLVLEQGARTQGTQAPTEGQSAPSPAGARKRSRRAQEVRPDMPRREVAPRAKGVRSLGRRMFQRKSV